MKLKIALKEQLDDLNDTEKLLVLNYLIQNLDKPDPEIDRAWIKEISKRDNEIKTKKVKLLTHSEVFGKYKK